MMNLPDLIDNSFYLPSTAHQFLKTGKGILICIKNEVPLLSKKTKWQINLCNRSY